MSVTGRVVHNSIRDKLRRIGWHHPVVGCDGCGDGMDIHGRYVPSARKPHRDHPRPVCLMRTRATRTHPGDHPRQRSRSGHAWDSRYGDSDDAALTLTNVRHVALSSLWRRRHRAIAAFLVGYLAVWIAVQTVIVGGTWGLLVPLIGWQTAAGVAMVAAALWEVAPIKRQRIRRCHRTVPLAPRGWRDTLIVRITVLLRVSVA